MQTGHPHGGFGADPRCHHSLRRVRIALLGKRARQMHGYQPSIQLVTCSMALAMCFSTVLMLN